MKLNELLDIDLLQKHVAERFVGVQNHPTLPLRIYNYTHNAQFDPKWGDGTIDYCRGLIVGPDNEIVARPFKKFHNLNTPSISETLEENLPKRRFHATKKYDGSLGIFYSFNGVEGVATRGSFTSPQAQWATTEYNRINYLRLCNWWPGYTPLFEIVYDENRIVIKYDFEGLVLIGMIDNETGDEMNLATLHCQGQANGFKVVEEVVATTEELKSTNNENEEGYVITYCNRNKDPLKVKVKMADYVRLHKIVTGMNARSVWELLKAGEDAQQKFKGMPEHFTNWVDKWVEKLSASYMSIQLACEDVYRNRPIYQGQENRKYRAECAAYFLQHDRVLKTILFLMLDGKDYSSAIWDQIEPRGDDKSFRDEE